MNHKLDFGVQRYGESPSLPIPKNNEIALKWGYWACGEVENTYF